MVRSVPVVFLRSTDEETEEELRVKLSEVEWETAGRMHVLTGAIDDPIAGTVEFRFRYQHWSYKGFGSVSYLGDGRARLVPSSLDEYTPRR